MFFLIFTPPDFCDNDIVLSRLYSTVRTKKIKTGSNC